MDEQPMKCPNCGLYPHIRYESDVMVTVTCPDCMRNGFGAVSSIRHDIYAAKCDAIHLWNEQVMKLRQSQYLKPCPFCGSPAEMKVERHLPKGEEYTPRCTEPSCAGRLTKKWTQRNSAIYAWNRRKS